MAIYYSRLSAVCRSKGHSVVAAAAYRAGARLVDERTATAHDYTKRCGVLCSVMLAPGSAPWARDIGRVWSLAERSEVRCNARTGRELIVALPAELTNAENERLARTLGQDLVDAYGVAVLVALHAPDTKGDERNTHAHLLMTTRAVNAHGFGAKTRVLDDRATGAVEAQVMRGRVAERINQALARAGHAIQVDPRRLTVQASDAADRGDFDGVVRLSRTPMQHQGRAATVRARRGQASVVVEGNAQRAVLNCALASWGTGRSLQLQRAVKARTERSGRAPRTVRAQEKRRGLGTVGTLARATGADAELLNAQARSMEETVRVERESAEAYLDAQARAADQIGIALRAGLERARREADAAEAKLSAERVDRLDASAARASEAARRAEAAFQEHMAQRRRAALAQHQTAKARAAEAVLDESRPVLWRWLSRREWAELRRRQRAETQRLERAEQAEARSLGCSAGKLDAASQEVRDAQRLLDGVRVAVRTQPRTPARKGNTPTDGAAETHDDSMESPMISDVSSATRARKWRR